LDDAILAGNADRVYAIPLRFDHVRSLNLSTAVGIVLYEALRQVALPDVS
jgi:tRNA (cytidine/uridine-2'-O-)-methyltransferase